MKIASMRVPVTFQKNTVTSDKYGNHTATWTDYFNGNRRRIYRP